MYSRIAFTVSSGGFQLVLCRAKESGKDEVSVKLHPWLLDVAVGSEGLRDRKPHVQWQPRACWFSRTGIAEAESWDPCRSSASDCTPQGELSLLV